MSPLFDELSFAGIWRRYQTAAIAAFDRDRRAGHRRTHIVAPPGSGKTLLGVDLIRRALVLAPNATVQLEWPRAVREFTRTPGEAATVAGPDPLQPIAVTYEGLTDVTDLEPIVGRLVQARWEAEATEGPPGEADLARIWAALRGEVARGEQAGLELAHLLSSDARRRVEQLRGMGVRMVLLDECHHLASLWGYVIRAVLAELGMGVPGAGLDRAVAGRREQLLHQPARGEPAGGVPRARRAGRGAGGRHGGAARVHAWPRGRARPAPRRRGARVRAGGRVRRRAGAHRGAAGRLAPARRAGAVWSRNAPPAYERLMRDVWV